MIRVNGIPSAMASLLFLALIAGCASSPDTSPATGGYASMEQIEGDPDRMVCVREKKTGSRMTSRVCKTAGEWEQERIDNQDAIRNATRSGVRPSNLPTAGGG